VPPKSTATNIALVAVVSSRSELVLPSSTVLRTTTVRKQGKTQKNAINSKINNLNDGCYSLSIPTPTADKVY
jgi:hypothetical protein